MFLKIFYSKQVYNVFILTLALNTILAHAKGGPRSRVCARKNPEFTPKYIIGGGFRNIFRGAILFFWGCSFGNSGPHAKIENPTKNFLEFTPKCIIVGVEVGVSEIFLGVQSYSFGNSGPHEKIQNPRTTPFGIKVRAGEEREKEEKITVLIEATSFATQPICNSTRAAHALRWNQQMFKLCPDFLYLKPMKV
jgi:hypothetical protein